MAGNLCEFHLARISPIVRSHCRGAASVSRFASPTTSQLKRNPHNFSISSLGHAQRGAPTDPIN